MNVDPTATRAVVLLVLVLVLAAVVVGSPDRSYDGNAIREDGGGLATAAAVEQAPDGHWWVLERSLDFDGIGVVYEYTSGWEPTGESYALEIPGGRASGESPVDIAPRSDSGWYVLGSNDTVYAFDEQWDYEGTNHTLPGQPGWTTTGRTSTFERTDAGWWVDAHGRLVLYDSQFERVLASYYGHGNLDLGEEYYNEHYGYMTVHDVTALHADSSGTLWLRTSLSDDTYGFETDSRGLRSSSPTRRFTPEKNPPHQSDLAGGPDGTTYVLRGNGRLYQYDRHWIHTGVTYRVGSGDAYDRYPPDMVSVGIFLEPILSFVSVLLPALALALLILVLRRTGRDRAPVYHAFGVSLVISFALFYEPYPLRPFLFVHPLVPVAVPLATIAAAGYHQYVCLDESRFVFLLYAPAVLESTRILLARSGIYLSTPL